MSNTPTIYENLRELVATVEPVIELFGKPTDLGEARRRRAPHRWFGVEG